MNKQIARGFATIVTLVVAIGLSGCNEQLELIKSKFAGPSEAPEASASDAQGATSEKDQWEYLVVSFGKTSFVEIDESIKAGSSKLVAFQEFADLLAGHEGIDLQAKLDLLGRFGWELVDTIGAIGGDQQMLLKRQRLVNRIAIEQEVLKKLSTILKEESEKREPQVQALLKEMEKYQREQATGSSDQLVEMDAKDKAVREHEAQVDASSKIAGMFRKAGSAYVKTTSISSVGVNVTADEDEKKRMNYGGSVTLRVDATEALLYEGNRYRLSKAKSIADQILALAIKEARLRKDTLTDFKLRIEMVIKFNGEEKVVATDYESVHIPGYKGTWARIRQTNPS